MDRLGAGKARIVYPPVALTAMGKPLSKASDGDHFDILWAWEDVTDSELQQGLGTYVVTRLKVRPEAFPIGSPVSV